MERTVRDWSVETLVKERPRITFPEYQRERSLWPVEKKSLLIDSMLTDIDIPKLYFNMRDDGIIEVIDGQQRLWAIWEYLDGEYSYDPKRERSKFANLTSSQKKKLKGYTFQVTELKNAEDPYLRKLFVRLQLGLLLNTGEKLNAATGKMKQLVFSKLSNHDLVGEIGIPKRRYAKETLCAQICINSFTRAKIGSFARTRYDDLLRFFDEYADPKGKDLELFNNESKKISNVMDQLSRCLGSRASNLKNRSYILSVYLFLEDLLTNGIGFSAGEQKQFSKFIFHLWKRLKDEADLGMDRTNRDLYEFQTFLSSAPGEEYQIIPADINTDLCGPIFAFRWT